jgi:hypothetical protein
MAVDAHEHRERIGMMSFERSRVRFRRISPAGLVILSGVDDPVVTLQVPHRSVERIIRAHVRKVSFADKVTGIGEMNVAIAERWKQRATCEIDTLACDTNRLFIECHYPRTIDEYRTMTYETSSADIETICANVKE